MPKKESQKEKEEKYGIGETIFDHISRKRKGETSDRKKKRKKVKTIFDKTKPIPDEQAEPPVNAGPR